MNYHYQKETSYILKAMRNVKRSNIIYLNINLLGCEGYRTVNKHKWRQLHYWHGSPCFTINYNLSIFNFTWAYNPYFFTMPENICSYGFFSCDLLFGSIDGWQQLKIGSGFCACLSAGDQCKTNRETSNFLSISPKVCWFICI